MYSHLNTVRLRLSVPHGLTYFFWCACPFRTERVDTLLPACPRVASSPGFPSTIVTKTSEAHSDQGSLDKSPLRERPLRESPRITSANQRSVQDQKSKDNMVPSSPGVATIPDFPSAPQHKMETPEL